MVRKVAFAVGAIALASAIGFSGQAMAAKKKVTYEQAWKLCKALLDKESPSTIENQNERYIRGGACMKKYGYGF